METPDKSRLGIVGHFPKLVQRKQGTAMYKANLGILPNSWKE